MAGTPDQITIRFIGIEALEDVLKRWEPEMRRKIRILLTSVGNAWVSRAKRIVPVETGRLRNSIVKSVSVLASGFKLVVGTNVKYGPFVEFGTEFIAGGRVKAIGLKPIVMEAEAIKDWPALAERGGSNQMMPWLRVSFGTVRPKLILGFKQALQPPVAAPKQTAV